MGHDLYDRPEQKQAERQIKQAERQIGNRALFRDARDAGFIDELRAAANGAWALGDLPFKREIANARGRRDEPPPRGRQSEPETPARRPS